MSTANYLAGLVSFQSSQDHQSSLHWPLLSALQSSSGVSSSKRLVVPSSLLILLSDLTLVEQQSILHRRGCELLAFLECSLGNRCRCKLPIFHNPAAEEFLFLITSSCLLNSFILPVKEPSSLQSLTGKDPSDFQCWSKERTSSCLVYSFILPGKEPSSFLSVTGKAPSGLQRWGKEIERGHVFDDSDMFAFNRG
jgi:hypothetical protein